MIGSEIRPNATSLQELPESTICENPLSEYMIDCYPYAMRGFLFGLLFSIVLCGILIDILMLVF